CPVLQCDHPGLAGRGCKSLIRRGSRLRDHCRFGRDSGREHVSQFPDGTRATPTAPGAARAGPLRRRPDPPSGRRERLDRSPALDSGERAANRQSGIFLLHHTVAAFVPLFTMQGVEGQIFNPMARTYGYALIGALIATFTITPVLASYLL